MKFKDLEKGKIYETMDGYFRFKNMRNDDIAIFEEVAYTDSDKLYIVDDYICKTKNDIQHFL